MFTCHFFFSVSLLQREIFFFLYSTMCTYAPAGRLLIANQKLCFHSDCSSPLWKVFSVVTKTTIQQWQTSVAHSWVDAVSGRSLDKQARRRKNRGQVGKSKSNQRATTRQREGGKAEKKKHSDERSLRCCFLVQFRSGGFTWTSSVKFQKVTRSVFCLLPS